MSDIYSYKYDKEILQLLVNLDITGRDKIKALSNRKILIRFIEHIKYLTTKKTHPKSKESNKMVASVAVANNDLPYIKTIFPDAKVVANINNQSISLNLLAYYGDNNKSKSFVKVDKQTLEVVALYSTIADLARQNGRKGTSIRYALANGGDVFEDYHVIRCEKIKTCPMCDKWIRSEDRHQYTLKANGVVTESSQCMPCEIAYKRRLQKATKEKQHDS